ncbi:hypothetical protein GWI33_003290, partial [Rhynchophorus ferrugineus]
KAENRNRLKIRDATSRIGCQFRPSPEKISKNPLTNPPPPPSSTLSENNARQANLKASISIDRHSNEDPSTLDNTAERTTTLKERNETKRNWPTGIRL